MSNSVKLVKDQRVYFGPCLLPSQWPAALKNGFEGMTEVASWYRPTPAELYNRNNAICSLDFWSRVCKTNVTVTQTQNVTDVSDDCNEDQQVPGTQVKSLNFTSNDYTGVISDTFPDGTPRPDPVNLPIPPDSVRCIEQSFKSKGCLLLPVMWLNCPKEDDGARGLIFLGIVSERNFPGGGLNDASTFSVTVVPGSTPGRAVDQLPMKNQICVSCFTKTPFSDLPLDYYIGEQVDEGSDLTGYVPPAIEICGTEVVPPDQTVVDDDCEAPLTAARVKPAVQPSTTTPSASPEGGN